MKIKRPKSIMIGSRKYKIKYVTGNNGGSFDYITGKMEIGVSKHDTLRTLEVIIHELKEMIQMEQWCRYSGSASNNFIFVYDHDKHTDLCARLAGLLDKFIK